MYFRDLVESDADWQRYQSVLDHFSQFVEDCLKMLLVPCLDVVMPRAYQQPRYFHATVWVLARHVLSSLDGVAVLVGKGCAENCGPLLRSALEGQMSLLYILQKDSEQRGLAYQLAHVHRKIKFLRTCDPQEQQGKAIRSELANDPFADVLSRIPVDPQKEIARLQEIFVQREYVPIEAEWQKTKKKKKGNEPDWFALFGGPSNVRALAKVVGQLSMYEFLYRSWSNVVHAGSGLESLADKDGKVVIKPIRHPDGLQGACRIAASLCMSVTRNLLQRFAADEMPKFQDVYVNQIQVRFRQVLGEPLIDAPWH